MAIIHIYSNYPDYKYLDDEDEGIACIDDAARAAIFYLNHFNHTNNNISIKKNKKLLEFLIHLQSENGYFYNFLWKDYSINKNFKTSLAEPNWWSWRALWALTESYPYYKSSDPNFAKKIITSIDKLIIAIKKQIPTEKEYEIVNGLKLPTWLPKKFASDQAAVLILGLVNYFRITNDIEIKDYIKLLSLGIIQMQIVDKNNPYYGAFLSWQNYWHAWGNNQAYALLKSYQLFDDKEFILPALRELNNFYPTIQANGFLNSFSVFQNGKNIIVENEKKFSQIAYNIRPMVFALIEAYKITNEEKYIHLAEKVAGWFINNNPTESIIYNSKTGLVFDGINSAQNINKNSGAESTIEALLSILEVNKNKLSTKNINLE